MAFDFPSSPTTGQTYSISGGPTYVYNGTAWVVLTPGNQFNRTVFTATAGQTSFAMNYVVGAIDVYRNGVKLAPADFTATDGTSIVLLNAATVGDTVEVISYPMITYSDAVKRTGDTMTGALAVPALTVNSVPVLAGPAFSAYNSAGQSISAGTYTKVNFPTEDFDTNNNFSSSRFTPTVAGYYQVSWSVSSNGSQPRILADLFKTGTSYARSSDLAGSSAVAFSVTGSTLVYCNGTTDYLEVYVFFQNAATAGDNGRVSTYFNGSLVRAA